MSMRAMQDYLRDPFLARLYGEIRAAGPLKSISVDITDACNLRCRGCYFFSEAMDAHREPRDKHALDEFITRERSRGTNFVTIVGGEPSLRIDRVRKLYDAFSVNVATNGLIRIPSDGLEDLPIGIALWGAHATDRDLRGSGRLDAFRRALDNYRGDARAFWYYTVMPDRASEIEGVVTECIANGNRVLFNYFGDTSETAAAGGGDRRFEAVRREIERMIDLYPDGILMSTYLNRVVSSGSLMEMQWGYEVCTSLSADVGVTAERAANGHPCNPHFRAFNADLTTTRRCCTRTNGSCASCYDVWQHFSWIMLNLRKHTGTLQDFTNWLTTMYLFYLINHLVTDEPGLLAEIHARMRGEGERTVHHSLRKESSHEKDTVHRTRDRRGVRVRDRRHTDGGI